MRTLSQWNASLERVIRPVLAIAMLALMLLLAAPAQASNWQLAGQSEDGRSQQYVDLDSLQGSGSRWTVRSYFTEPSRSASGSWDHSLPPVRADYITKYDCETQRYKDIAADGSEPQQWGETAADPLNRASLNLVCAHVASASH